MHIPLYELTHFNGCILTKIAHAILVKIPVEMCQFTKIPMTRLNMSLMLQNFSQCMLTTMVFFLVLRHQQYTISHCQAMENECTVLFLSV